MLIKYKIKLTSLKNSNFKLEYQIVFLYKN